MGDLGRVDLLRFSFEDGGFFQVLILGFIVDGAGELPYLVSL